MGHVRFYCTCIHGVGLYIIDDYVNMVHKKKYIYICMHQHTIFSPRKIHLFLSMCSNAIANTECFFLGAPPPEAGFYPPCGHAFHVE